MKTSRIVFLTSSTHGGGTYIRAFFLGKYLAKEGHEVSLLAISEKVTLRATKKLVDGVNVFLLPSVIFSAPPHNLLLNQLSRILSSCMQTLLYCILTIISDCDIFHSFDVVGPQNAVPTLLSRTACSSRVQDRKIFVDWDEWWGKGGVFSLYSGVYPLIAPLLEFMEEKIPHYADAVTLLNETLRQRALWAGLEPENLFVIPTGADTESIRPLNIHDAREKLNLPIENIIYTQVGLLPLEAFKLLMLAHKEVLRSCPDALLLLMGRIEKGRLDFVKSLNLTKNVISVGWQPYDKYRLYLGASDVFLLPMQDSLYDRARNPLRLGDYLAAGRPIIATGLPEIKKIVGECGFPAEPDDPMDFADKILQMIRDPDSRKEMGKRARELAETKYSWQILAKQLEKVYSHFL